MKKYIAALIILLMIPVTVFAHSGDTDANGGHYDHSTGKYHYHHGYPAHDHYDMDGNGTVDCPYDFDDRTGSNSGVSSKNKNTTTEMPGKESSKNRETRLSATNGDWILFIACCLVVIGVIIIVLYLIRNKISDLQTKPQKRTAAVSFFVMLLLSIIPFFLLNYTGNVYQPSLNGNGFIASALVLIVVEYIITILIGGCIAGIILCIAAIILVKNNRSPDVPEPWESIIWIAMYVPHIPISIIMLFYLFGIVKL